MGLPNIRIFCRTFMDCKVMYILTIFFDMSTGTMTSSQEIRPKHGPSRLSGERNPPRPQPASFSLVEDSEYNEPLINPGESFPTVLTEEKLNQIASSFGIPRSSMRLPGPNDTPGNPPEGYMAWSKYHCMCGTVPPLNQWIASFVNFLRIAPMQLQPNSYAMLNSMYVIFMQRYNRRPTFREIRFFYNVRNYRKAGQLKRLAVP